MNDSDLALHQLCLLAVFETSAAKRAEPDNKHVAMMAEIIMELAEYAVLSRENPMAFAEDVAEEIKARIRGKVH